MASKTIVVGVDTSDTASAAAARAAELAVALDAQLWVVSSFVGHDAETVDVGSDTFVLSSATEAEAIADEVAGRLRAEHPNLDISSGPAEGKPGEALVSFADRLDADLIVVGNKRVQGVARVLGSIARDIAAHASCDVYVAHTHPRK